MDSSSLSQADTKLDSNNLLLAQAVENIVDYGIFMMDPAGHILSWNRGAHKISGYSESEIKGKHFSLFYTADANARNHPAFELEKAKSMGNYEEEGWRVKKNGTMFWASVLITAITNDQGELLGFSKITRDLTERKKAEEKLIESEARFRLLVEGVKDYAIFALDKKGYVVSWNEGAKNFKGYEESEILGKHFSIFYSKDEVDYGKCEYELEEAALTGRFEDEGWRIRKDGTRFWANVVITALKKEDGQLIGYSKVTRDLTERKRAEDKLRRLSESLDRRVHLRTAELARAQEELEKALVSRDEFISMATHELRNPLATLLMQNELLIQLMSTEDFRQRNSEIADDLADLTGAAKRSGERLNHLIEDLFSTSLMRKGQLQFKFTQVNLSHLLQDLLKSWKYPLASVDCELQAQLEDDIVLLADPHRIEQVIANLLTNAMKYAAGKPVKVELSKNDGNCIINVIDQGPGIAPQLQTKIFEVYERGNNSFNSNGLGLGLYISKSIVETHGGSIAASNDEQGGCRFTIILPLGVH